MSLRGVLKAFRTTWQSLMEIEIAEFIPSDVTEIASLTLAMTYNSYVTVFMELCISPKQNPIIVPKILSPVKFFCTLLAMTCPEGSSR